jgi:hypothetical protein
MTKICNLCGAFRNDINEEGLCEICADKHENDRWETEDY